MQFKDALDVCRPANMSLVGSAVIIVIWITRNVKSMKMDVKSIMPLVTLAVLAVIMAVNLDVYCKTKHEQFAWFMAGLAVVTFACVALCTDPKPTKAEKKAIA